MSKDKTKKIQHALSGHQTKVRDQEVEQHDHLTVSRVQQGHDEELC